MAKHWADFQYEIYLNGMKGAVPRLPTDLTRLEELTERRLGPGPVGYVAGGAGDGARQVINPRTSIPAEGGGGQAEKVRRRIPTGPFGVRCGAPLWIPASKAVLHTALENGLPTTASSVQPGHTASLRGREGNQAGHRGEAGYQYP